MRLLLIIFSTFCVLPFSAQKSNPAPSIPATDEYFGTKIVDEYRNLENLDNPQTLNWMKSQSNFTDSILNLIPKRNFFLEKRLELDKRQGYSISNLNITRNNKYFYLKKSESEKIAKLYYRDGLSGKEEILYDPTNYRSEESDHDYVINYISPSWDGNTVAISMSEKGNELAEVIIMNVATR